MEERENKQPISDHLIRDLCNPESYVGAAGFTKRKRPDKHICLQAAKPVQGGSKPVPCRA